MTEYILALLALAATLLGIFGNTYERGQVTPLGWAVAGIAGIVCSVTVIKHRRQRQDEQRIAHVGYSRVLRGIHGVLYPFAVMLADIDLRKKIPGTGPTALNERLSRFVSASEAELRSEALLEIYSDLPQLVVHDEIFTSYILGDHTAVLGNQGPTWIELFQRTTLHALQELDFTMSTYRAVMSASCVAAIEQFRTTWLVQRITQMGQADPDDIAGEFFQLRNTIPGHASSIYSELLQSAEKTQRLVIDSLDV